MTEQGPILVVNIPTMSGMIRSAKMIVLVGAHLDGTICHLLVRKRASEYIWGCLSSQAAENAPVCMTAAVGAHLTSLSSGPQRPAMQAFPYLSAS